MAVREVNELWKNIHIWVWYFKVIWYAAEQTPTPISPQYDMRREPLMDLGLPSKP
jgi:hypothetical protein